MNKFLTQNMYEVLDELDLSHSGELIFDNGWYIDDVEVDESGIQDLYLLRLIRLAYTNKGIEHWKITDDGVNCLTNNSYVPKIALPVKNYSLVGI